MKMSNGEKIFTFLNYCVLSIVIMITLYPFVYVLSASISSGDAVTSGKVILLPKAITFDAYRTVLNTKGIWIAYGNTIFYTVVGTMTSILVTICGAYPLSKKRLMGRKFITFMVAFTMWFSAGMIPFYLNLKSLDLIDSRLGIIIAFSCSAFYVILLRTYFQSIPESLEESAKIDGANDFTILGKIILPLSLPALLTIGLYYAVERWNGFFWAMILLKDENKIPLQVLLKKLIVEMSASSDAINAIDIQKFNQETIIYATIVISIIPIIAIYPYIQGFFVKGIMVGSVKG